MKIIKIIIKNRIEEFKTPFNEIKLNIIDLNTELT